MLKITGICITNQNEEGFRLACREFSSRELRVKAKFDQFRSFVFGFLPFPLAYRILSRLYQQRISTDHLNRFHVAIRQNQRFQLDSSAQVQGPSHSRITRHYAIRDLARSLRLFRRITLCRN